MNSKTQKLVLYISFLVLSAVAIAWITNKKGPQTIRGRINMIGAFNPQSDEDVTFFLDVQGKGKNDYRVNLNSTEAFDLIKKCVDLKEECATKGGQSALFGASDSVYVRATFEEGKYVIDSL